MKVVVKDNKDEVINIEEKEITDEIFISQIKIIDAEIKRLKTNQGK